MIFDPALLLFLLVAFHFVADYGLQTQYVAVNKVRAKGNPDWALILGAHSMIHAAPVALLTGVWWLGAAEAVAHFAIDHLKGTHHTTHGQDQALHLICKLIWWACWLALVAAHA